jgi:quercetin dioxygenase-like cupin family protein
MPYKRLWKIPSKKVAPPNERNLQILYSPQQDQKVANATFLMSTLAPHTGQTGVHTHPVDEIIYVITGRGEGEDEGKTFMLAPGTIIYAPAGVKHNCKNYSDESMQMYCVYVPALPDEVVKNLLNEAIVRVPMSERS